jgi:hypothetical protein
MVRLTALKSDPTPERSNTLSDATTTLLRSWEEKEHGDGGMLVTSFSAGDPHTWAIYNAVLDRYNAITDREQPTEEDLERLLNEKVTVVMHGENMIGGASITAIEGTLKRGRSARYMILPKRKRTNGYRVDPANVLDIFPGYSADAAKALMEQARSHFPKLRQLTPERLEELPFESSTVSLCLFGSYHMPDDIQRDAIVLAAEYDKENDIVDGGVVLVRPQYGVSEHGSVYGQYLLHWKLGEVVDFQPISFAEALALCELDFDEAYARVISPTLAVA